MRPIVYFLSGLPRSGSTLLNNILGQNPSFSVDGTSGLCELLVRIRNEWDRIPEFRAMALNDSNLQKSVTLTSVLNSFCDDEDVVYIDKSRTWPAHIEMLQEVMYKPVKIIVCIRDVREVLASLECLWRKLSATRLLNAEANNHDLFQTLPGRLQCWMANNGLVGIAFNRVVDAVNRGHRDKLHFVDYEDLCRDPGSVLSGVYAFLDLPGFRHDFDDVKQITQEDDLAYNFPGLHNIRSKVEWQQPKWPSVLGVYANAYEPANKILREISRPREATGLVDRNAFDALPEGSGH